MTATYDFIIIGGGIAGASAGYFLSPHGRTLILEREEFPGYHTTGRSAAFYAQTYGNEVVQQLTRAAGPFLFDPPEGFSDTPLVRPRGAVYVAKPEQSDHLQHDFRIKKQISPEIELLTPGEVEKRVPSLRRGYAAAGYSEPGCQDIDVHALHQGYLKGTRARNGEILCNQTVTAIARQDGLWQVETRNGPLTGRILVNAAGAWGDEVARLAGLEGVNLEPRRRTVVCADVRGSEISADLPLVLDVQDRFYFKPEGEGILLSPCDETPMPPCDVQPEELDVARGIDRVEAATDLRIIHLRRKWSGLRTFARDRSPVIGFDPDREAFFWCVGQGGFGIQTSPAIGSLVRDLIVEGKTDSGLPVTEISPARFRS